MIDDIPSDPVIGDAVIKTETITWQQMTQEINQENLLYNPEMNAEMKQKWNKERLKYFDENTDEEKHASNIRMNKLMSELLIEAYNSPCDCSPCKSMQIPDEQEWDDAKVHQWSIERKLTACMCIPCIEKIEKKEKNI